VCWSSWFSKPCQKSTHMCRLYSEQRRCAAEAEAVIRPDRTLAWACADVLLGGLASRLEERGTAGEWRRCVACFGVTERGSPRHEG
jgi:hypothetical protein